jgi:hypothetical protein
LKVRNVMCKQKDCIETSTFYQAFLRIFVRN